MRAVNLLPDPRVDTREQSVESRARSTRTIALAAVAALVLIAVVVGYSFVQGRSGVHDRQARLHGLQAKVAKTQAAAAVSAVVAAQRQAHLAAITSAASGRTGWDYVLDEISRVMPSGAWLETL